MTKTLAEAPVTTARARTRLGPGVHWKRLDAEAHLGYRKGAGGGVWLVRWRSRGGGASYRQATIGPANEANDKRVEGVLTYDQAASLGMKRVERERAAAAAMASGPLLTVRSAVEDYITIRTMRERRREGSMAVSNAGSRLTRHVLEADISELALHSLTEADLMRWRAGLPETMKPSTRRRLSNDLKAAINATYLANRQRLDPKLPSILRHGLAMASDASEAPDETARENQILTDAQVGQLIGAAREVDAEQGWDGDLYRMVVVLAATGARFSQAARLRVDGCQREHGRLIVPASRKGRGKAGGTIAVPVGNDVMQALLPVATGRPASAALLECWTFERVFSTKGAGFRWRRVRRRPWQAASDLTRLWSAVRDRAGMPDVIPYALRHSSIVRGIRANLPIRLVAAMHDTSVVMIERHYSKWIVDAAQELAARAVVPLVPAADCAPNVVPISKADVAA